MGFFDLFRTKHTRRVVVVEDDVPLRRFIADRLLENGVDVVETGDGATALDTIQQNQPQCVVLDVMLPGKNGMQILAELRAVDKKTPVVVLTTLSGEGGLKLEASKHNAVFLNKADTSLEIVIETIMRHAQTD
jgi:DNA-binding response OmpR family regulator